MILNVVVYNCWCKFTNCIVLYYLIEYLLNVSTPLCRYVNGVRLGIFNSHKCNKFNNEIYILRATRAR